MIIIIIIIIINYGYYCFDEPHDAFEVNFLMKTKRVSDETSSIVSIIIIIIIVIIIIIIIGFFKLQLSE